ncbi:maleylpyruvate isomerase [Arthrobacter sp. SLBN-100]|uniref:maleylpyruvate isomerase family mycothiol-dependent enzyme n=1 Tax=Arthrobacter sp. SLBN-100 TaxID=2768450 RepID=UPI00115258D5|nr:maleylpyruvate isomerase family mycothiol-dependent enzyme [Arthrobacter sp. SLBN-100]TQJ62150.1 maleylpyruvate isomerase [Arthrobacter sp. SLBN-100]
MAARQDLTDDHTLLTELLTVRRGTAFFSRHLAILADSELDGPSLLPGWSRRHIVAHVGYNARALTRLVEWANTGVETPMYSSPEARDEEIEAGATLPVHALRHLHEHAAITLDVTWRDTPPPVWAREVKTAHGRAVTASETVWMRTREILVHTVDLDSGASFADFPVHVNERLLTDVAATWRARGQDRGLRLIITGTPSTTRPNTSEWGDFDAVDPEIVSGTLPALTGWALGRSRDGISSSRRDHPVAPRWI